MRVAAITMVYNEGYFLPIWLKYYSDQLGCENLYVIDHGSDDGSTEEIKANRVRIPRIDVDEDVRARFVSRFHSALLEYFDFVLYCDVDEFIIVRPSKYNSLLTYFQSGWKGVHRCVGVDVFQHDPKMTRVNPNETILKQRPYGRFNYYLSKPLMSSIPTEWAPGFHECNVESEVDSDVFLFHLKLADQSHMLERLAITRSLRWSEATLKKGHSAHHRLSDDEMLEKMLEVQSNRTEGYLDLADFSILFGSKGQSKQLMKIPDEFLHML